MLPIHQHFATIRQGFHHHAQVILQAPTGAGKSTALPREILNWEEFQGKIILLEPRRVAARSIAAFLAKQLAEPVGHSVGYRVRGETKVSAHTRLEVVTEGVLTRMIQQDPELTGVDLVIFDEVHERHLTTDLSLALALEVQASLREDLKLLVMSATLEGLNLTQLMPEALSVATEGRSFPITIAYQGLKPQQEWLPQLGAAICRLLQTAAGKEAQQELSGLKSIEGVLAFLPGQREIRQLAQYLQQRLSDHYAILPLYGELSGQAQDQAVQPLTDGRIKVVLATNVAESSLTIQGINVVVDSGYQRTTEFNPRLGVNKLVLKRISQASATQRAGRAGRLAEGYCLRLGSAEELTRQAKTDQPEILRADLLSLALECANWGLKSIAELPLLDLPPQAHEQQAWQLLKQLEFVDQQHKLTALGRQAYQLGCQPRLAHMLLASPKPLLPLACVLATIIEARGLPRLGVDLEAYLSSAQQMPLKADLNQWLKQFKLSDIQLAQALRARTHADLGLLLALAYPDRIAKRRATQAGGLTWQLANGTAVTMDDDAALAHQPWLVVADFQLLQHQAMGRVYLAVSFDPQLFAQALAHLLTEHTEFALDESKGRFIAEQQQKMGHLVWQSKRLPQVSAAQLAQAFTAYVQQKGVQALHWDEKAVQLQYRMKLARAFDQASVEQEQDWPDFSTEALLKNTAHWLSPYLSDVSSLAQLQKLNGYQLLWQSLSWAQQQRLSEILPTHWPLTTGTNAPLEYQADGRVLLSARLQEVFGLAQSPTLCAGKLTVTMELLSPARRPLALTSDLASFWAGPYVEVKKEMKGRYPKHIWPDDPLSTTATKYTKKRAQGQ